MKVILRPLFSLLGAIFAMLRPTLPYMLICTMVIFADCYTAWQLDKRVKAKYGKRAPKESGKFRSSNAGRVIHTLIEVYVLIILAFFINLYITSGLGIDMTKEGQLVGWMYDLDNPIGDNRVDFGIFSRIDETTSDLKVDFDLYSRTILYTSSLSSFGLYILSSR